MASTATINDLDAEVSVLGAMLLVPATVETVSAILKASDFYRPDHGRIFQAIIDIELEGDTPDPILVCDHLKQAGKLKDDDRAYISSLPSACPAASQATKYADIIKRLSLSRSLKALSASIDAQIADEEDPQNIQRSIADTLDQLEGVSVKSDLRPMKELADEHFQHMQALTHQEKKAGIPTGFCSLDTLTNGFMPTRLTILAARPAMGKTAFALNLVHNIARQSGAAPIAFFALEQAAIELNSRLIALISQVDSMRIQVANLTDHEWTKVTQAHGDLANLPIYIDDSATNTMSEIRSKCRRLKRKHGLGLVVLDYIQLLTPNKDKDNREQEVAAMSRALKQLAREQECHVLALSQLSRQCDYRADKRPVLSDLRESGAIEQDADLVAMLYRDEVYNKDSDDKGLVEVGITKNRHGPIGDFKLAYIKEHSRFGELPRMAAGRPYSEKE